MTATAECSRRNFVLGVSGVAANPFLSALSSAARANPRDAAPEGTSLSRQLADYICNVRYEDLDPLAVARAKEHLIYHVGLAFSGALTSPGRQALKLAAGPLYGPGNATVIGQRDTVSPLAAAFANSTFIRALGFDDVLFPSATHAGLLTYPVALAIGEEFEASGRELLVAIVTAYEILGKLVTGDGPGRAPRRPSMPFGPLAGATAAARLMKLSPAQTAHALGYAADGAMGLKEGHEQQPSHIYGLISRTAITAAYLARAGGETAATIFEGKYGFFSTIVGSVPDSAKIVGILGKDPEILRATQKRYPGTAMNIVPIQILLDFTQKYKLRASDVKRVDIELPEFRRTFEDSISKGPFPTYTQAASSLPFQSAIILLDGRIDLIRYEQRHNNEILEVVARIFINLKPHQNNRFARVSITMANSIVHHMEGDNYVFPPLDGQEWLSRDGKNFVDMDKLARFAVMVKKLEDISNIRNFMNYLRPKA